MNNAMSKLQYYVKFDVVKHDEVKTFERFQSLFTAHANSNGYGEILKEKVTVPKEGDLTSEEKKKTYSMNTKGYCALLMATQDDPEAFMIVDGAKTKDYPNGNLVTAMKELKATFTESKRLKKKKLESQWNSRRRFGNSKSPEKIITKIYEIKRLLKVKFSIEKTEDETLEVILRRLPKMYKKDKSFWTYDLAKGTLVKETLLEQMIGTYEKKYDDSGEESESTSDGESAEEDALVSKEATACSFCGKLGHLGVYCWLNPRNPYNRIDELKNNPPKWENQARWGTKSNGEGRSSYPTKSNDQSGRPRNF